ncbi:MAG: DUF2087 domain-containing protein [Clostridium sp.]|uniref:DUF2087 domain-containing protein n=1 Tax=Clostridium sp. TaxID=1506 RepID=UPI00290BE7E8|nr:DUF2087 domain-containing protein [Clostridium sp.]MDU7336756.1 DUF2087 domain-containing protein [Clostridium sp.]
MEQNKKIARFLSPEGKITQLPQKQSVRLALLSYLSQQFEENRFYTEQEVNALCEEWHTFGDYFLLRRELIDQHFLCRKADGSLYWKVKEEAEPDPVVT